MLSEKEGRRLLLEGAVSPGPFAMRIQEDTERGRGYSIRLEWHGMEEAFFALYRDVATPLKVEEALGSVKNAIQETPGVNPMIIVPFISEQMAQRLQKEHVSGLDLSGNFVVDVPGKWLVVRTNMPNRFPSSQPLKKVFEGRSAFVSRALLQRSSFDRVKDIKTWIEDKGGDISLGTVSKVLTVLQAELLVNRENGIHVMQPDKLLDRLASNYRGPNVTRTLIGKADTDLDFFRRLRVAADHAGVQIAGRSEAKYAIAPVTSDRTVIYVSRMGSWLNSVPIEETHRFPNIEILETTDEDVFFDVTEYDGFPWCSLLQIYLELMQGGKREQEVAAQLKRDLVQNGTAR